MTRVPLRPLARILDARAKGEDPDLIEAENLRQRHEAMADKARARAEGRLLVIAVLFLCGFIAVGVRMGTIAASEPVEPRAATAGAPIATARADIVDRRGRLLATNLVTNSLYAQTRDMVDPARAARELAMIFPDLDARALYEDFTGGRKFLWIRKTLSPEQQQAVFDIGEPGLLFGPREMRLYPNGAVASHVLGGTRFGDEGVNAAQVVGVAGVEMAFEDRLSDPGRSDTPLALSIDLTIQAAVERVLAGGMQIMNAEGAAAILMDVHSGEIVALASLPDFDPNDRPSPLTKGQPADSPLFNRAVQGVYELGSTFKIFAAAQALELGLVNPNTPIDTKGPISWGRFRIKDMHRMDPVMSMTDVIVESSNVGTARVAQMIGPERQRDFLTRLGFTETLPVELVEARRAKPLVPERWSELSAMTISYGHGISVTPLHLAAAYAAMVNGGTRVTPTLERRASVEPGPRVISPETSAVIRSMLRQVVARGTASYGEVAGYQVGGKTGSADKPSATGGYEKDSVIATFAGIFPANDPKYVLIVSLDDGVDTSGPEPRRTAGYTAVPIAAEVIRRVAPLLGLKPEIEPGVAPGVTLTSN